MLKISVLFIICTLTLFACEDFKKVISPPVSTDNNITTGIKQKIAEFKRTPARVEVRNYLKDPRHKYQERVKLIKKMKTPLYSKSEVYLELNLFTNEDDQNAPLVVQLMWFDVKTKNLILEENVNLD